MCKTKDQQLSTTQTSIGPIRYYIKRCCDHCQAVMRLNIDHTMMILVADRKQLEKEMEKNK
jgi:lipopolysaccharide/colanic/teichoic acid biosynthesis glycosyltransferase